MDETFKRKFRNAVAQGQRAQPRAKSAYYDELSAMIIVPLSSGAFYAFPTEIVQGLHGASPTELADLEIHGAGTVLHWRSLDVQFELMALLTGVFGTDAWMRELGRLGGSVSS